MSGPGTIRAAARQPVTPGGTGQIGLFQGLPCIELSLPRGDRAIVSLHGAQVLSWTTADGNERLYFSPRARTDGVAAVRAGVPIVFPQFNERALGPVPLPKHGLARTQPWELIGVDQAAELSVATMELKSSPRTLAIWPNDFAAICTVELEENSLCIEFAVRNTGELTFPFAIALHTYLRTDDIARTELIGLSGMSFWDGVQHRNQPAMRSVQAEDSLRFAGEIDRVYTRVKSPILMRHQGGAVRIEQSSSFPEAVVWNPGAVLCSTLGDMRPDGFKNMLCVEAARINTPQTLMPGEMWRGWQSLRAMPEKFRPSGFHAD